MSIQKIERKDGGCSIEIEGSNGELIFCAARALVNLYQKNANHEQMDLDEFLQAVSHDARILMKHPEAMNKCGMS